MAEQMELFPDSKWSGDSNHKRTQLSYLLHLPEEVVDERLLLDAWYSHTGENLIETVKQGLCSALGCTPHELVRLLRERKLRLLIGSRINLGMKKLLTLSVRPERKADSARA